MQTVVRYKHSWHCISYKDSALKFVWSNSVLNSICAKIILLSWCIKIFYIEDLYTITDIFRLKKKNHTLIVIKAVGTNY